MVRLPRSRLPRPDGQVARKDIGVRERRFTLTGQKTPLRLGAVLSGYRARFGFGAAFDATGEGMVVEQDTAQNLVALFRTCVTTSLSFSWL